MQLENAIKIFKEELAATIDTNQSAVSEKSSAYKKSKRRFKKNILAMDYEKEKKIQEAVITKFESPEHFNRWLRTAKPESILNKGKKDIANFDYEKAFIKLLGSPYSKYARLAYKEWKNLNKEKAKEKVYTELNPASLANIDLYGIIPEFDRNRAMKRIIDTIEQGNDPNINIAKLLIGPLERWDNIDYSYVITELRRIEKKLDKKQQEKIEDVIAIIPKNVKETRNEIEHIKKHATEFPNKKLKLRK
jgi:hypothetical protein